MFPFLFFKANGEVTKLRVENSWGDDRGDKGNVRKALDLFNIDNFIIT